MLKATESLWKKSKTQWNGKTFYAYGLKEQILLKCQYHPKQSTHSIQSLTIEHQYFYRARTNNPKICMEPQKTASNVEKENLSWRHQNYGLQAVILKL